MIHQYKNNGYNIIMDVCSGAVHVVDDVVYDVLTLYTEYEEQWQKTADTKEASCDADCIHCNRMLKDEEKDTIAKTLNTKYKKEDVIEAISEIEELKAQGMLYAPDEYKEAVIDFKKRKTVVKALCLHIAHDCNLACRYCFAEEGEYHGRRALMSLEVGKKALDFLIANSGSRRNLEVDFFGGEPTMNWDVVKQIVAYGRSLEKKYDKNFRFTLTTNGVLLNDEMMEFANKEMNNVVMSIDGRKEVNDRMRPFRNGKGSYDLIVPKFQKFADMRHQTKLCERYIYT